MIRTYTELSRLTSFEERFQYLKLNGIVGESTFGFDRYINQLFYRSSEWKKLRDIVIVRDEGCDLGLAGYDMHGKIYIHHMNPISRRDIETLDDRLLNPEYLIATSHNTHNAIHYGDEELLLLAPMERSRFDTCPWKR